MSKPKNILSRGEWEEYQYLSETGETEALQKINSNTKLTELVKDGVYTKEEVDGYLATLLEEIGALHPGRHLYVNSLTGDDTNPGTKESPLKTLNKALEISSKLQYSKISLHSDGAYEYNSGSSTFKRIMYHSAFFDVVSYGGSGRAKVLIDIDILGKNIALFGSTGKFTDIDFTIQTAAMSGYNGCFGVFSSSLLFFRCSIVGEKAGSEPGSALCYHGETNSSFMSLGFYGCDIKKHSCGKHRFKWWSSYDSAPRNYQRYNLKMV